MTIRTSLQGLCTQFQDLKYLAQKAIICQLKSLYHKARNKQDVLANIDLKELAFSHGLIQVPKVSLNTPQRKPAEEAIVEETPVEEAVPSKTTKKSRKLEKLKRKIKLKKQKQKQGNQSEIDDKYLVKNLDGQLNELRDNPLMKRGDAVIDRSGEGEVEDFLTKKQGPVIIGDLDVKSMGLSKRKLKKIKPSGPFGGKNIMEIDEKGHLKSRENTFKEKFKGGDTRDRVGQFKSKLGIGLMQRREEGAG